MENYAKSHVLLLNIPQCLILYYHVQIHRVQIETLQGEQVVLISVCERNYCIFLSRHRDYIIAFQ